MLIFERCIKKDEIVITLFLPVILARKREVDISEFIYLSIN
ncbi:hypothetical protein FORC065_2910 [Yersinia enterocolitica]|nr:hypothetical protein FORC065_2910 [Yersinia enterocolitica]